MRINATHKKAIDHYYQELTAYQTHKVTHETAVRSTFQNLLATFAKSANWTLIPEQILENGKRPDGTMRDTFNLPRGYWEAKDTKDDLKTEIRKKITLGYPITNTIFEDTRRAILYQNNKQVLEINLAKPKELIDVLDLDMTDQRRWTHEELKRLLDMNSIKLLEKLIADPGRQYRQEFAHDYAISALKNIPESEVLPDDIRGQVLHILELHGKASSPFLGMNLSTRKEETQS